MPFVPVSDCAMVSIFYQSNDGSVAMNRLFVGTPNPTTTEDLAEITDAVYDWWNANLKTYTQADWSLTGIQARDMSTEEGLLYIDENSYPVAGLSSDTIQQPAQVSYTITLNTGLVGRSARGRVYGVGLPNSFQQGNRLTDAARPVLQAVWDLLFEAMETAGHALLVVSFIDEGVPRAEGRALPVVSVNVRFPLATQRRRLS
jgi:hypothetical protein